MTAVPVSSSDPSDAEFSTAASVSQFIIMNAMPCHAFEIYKMSRHAMPLKNIKCLNESSTRQNCLCKLFFSVIKQIRHTI